MQLQIHKPDETQFDFLGYLRQQHHHWLTREPQTAHSISERRRLARAYAQMRPIERPAHPYAEVQA
jgi:hypothetical protein